jgi:O-antigen/teichoic acid export membrane protein
LEEVPAQGAPRSRSGLGSRLLRNTALILVARILAQLLALVTVLVVQYHLRQVGYGRFSIVVNTSAIATVFLDAGFNTLYQREAARRPAQLETYLSRLATGRLGFALLSLGFFSLFLWIQGLLPFLLPAYLMMVLSSYAGLLRGSLYAVQRLGYEAVAIVLDSAILLGLVLWGALTGQGVAFFLWAYTVRYAFDCIYYGLVLELARIARIRWQLDPVFLVNWLVKGLPFAAAFVITTIYFNIDVVILGFVRGDFETGVYSSAYKPFQALLFIPISMLNVVFPVLSVTHKERAEEVAGTVNRFFRGLLVLGWPICVGTAMLAYPLDHLLHLFPQSAAPLRVLALGIGFMFCSNAFIGALNAIDRQVMFTWAALGSMVVNLALNVVLIPLFGYMGASWSTVLTEVALFCFGWALTARYLAPVPIWRLSWRILLAGLVMGAVLYPFQQVHGLITVAIVVLGAAVYGAALFAFRGLDREELALARRALRL